ncbi:Diacylglycerol kinase [Tilletia horrida]|nr:Diacylglycerol kinase [Tilletia horrida]
MPRKKAHVRSGSKAGPIAPASVVLPQRSSSIQTSVASISPSSSTSSNNLPASTSPDQMEASANSGSLTATAEALLAASKTEAPPPPPPSASASASAVPAFAPAPTPTPIQPTTATSTALNNGTAAKPRHHSRSSSVQKSVAVLRALSRSPSQDDDHYFHIAGLTPANGTTASANGSAAEKDAHEPSAAGVPARRSSLKPKGRFPSPLITEKPRKVFHSSIGFLVLHLYLSHSDLDGIVRGLSYFLGIVLTADVIRLNSPPFERLYEKVLGFLMRETEKTRCNGVVFYLIGTIVTLRLFPEDIACVGIMTLSWADTAASLFGRIFGSFTPPLPSPPFASRKSLAGFLAAAAAGAGIAALFWGTKIAGAGERVGTGLSWLGRIPPSAVDPGATFGTAAIGTGWQGLGRGFVPRPISGLGKILSDAAGSVSGAAQAAGKEGSAADSGVGSWLWGKASSVASGTASTLASASNLAGSISTPGGKVVPSMPLWLLSVSTGLVAAVAESLELGGLDDNLTLPLLSAAGLTGVLYAWGKVGDWVLNGSGASLVGAIWNR